MNNQQYPNPMNGGYAYGVAKPQASNSQPLSVDIVNTLRQDGSELNMKIDQKDIWRAICTHKDPTSGQNTLVQNEDGSYTCAICGHTFDFFEGAPEDVKNAVKVLIDMLQTCKTIYLDAPIKMTEQYYQIIPLLEKFPTLWTHAMRNFSKYENTNNPLNPISGGYSGFAALNTLMANPYAGYQQPMMMQQPMMGYQQPQMAGYQQPMMGYQQPVQNPQMMGYQQPMMQQQPVMDPTNPMGYNSVPAAPVAPAPGVMPAAPAPAAEPAAAAPQSGEVQQQKVFNV